MEPFGERRADQRAWLVAAQIFNANRGERSRPIDLGEILPDWRPPQTAEDWGATWTAFFDRYEARREGK